MICNSQVLRAWPRDGSQRTLRPERLSPGQRDGPLRVKSAACTAAAPVGLGAHRPVTRGRGGLATRFPIADAVRALAHDDLERTLDLADRVLAHTGSRLAVMADLLYPAQLELSDHWYTGGATAQQEVKAAHLVRRVIEELPPTPAPNTVARGSRCVLATLPGDPHDLGLRMLAIALEDDGWEVDVQVASHPLLEWTRLAAQRPTRLLGLSVAVPPSVGVLTQMIEIAHQQRTPVLVGGVAFVRMASLADKVDADAFGPDARAACVLARRLVAR